MFAGNFVRSDELGSELSRLLFGKQGQIHYAWDDSEDLLELLSDSARIPRWVNKTAGSRFLKAGH